MAKVKRALISVSDKTGIVRLCRSLDALGVEILSTGGTAAVLGDSNIKVIEISDYTGFPEMMDGRVKTLHPKVHAGLLGRRGVDEAVMRQNDIGTIDLAVVNLYPFEQTVSRPDCILAEAIENIDIGGPAMLRSAAKNYASVAVVVDPTDYDMILTELKDNDGVISHATRFHLACKVFAQTARYDAGISNYLGALNDVGEPTDYPLTYSVQFQKRQQLRYGENPHQTAAFYTEPEPPPGTLAATRQHCGKELSYNNIADADAALECVQSFADTACVIVKHANPCGVAVADTPLAAYQRAYKADPVSAFGGIIAFNRALDADTARAIIECQFVEVIIVPETTPECVGIIAKKAGVRLLETGYRKWAIQQLELNRVSGGLLVQDNDSGFIEKDCLQVVTKRQPTEQEFVDLVFAWRVVKYVKSNAIVYAKDNQTLGIGAGQMSRVYSVQMAILKAQDENLSLAGSVMASDAFLPFRDGLDSAAVAGASAVIQPGGSVRDEEVIAAADKHDMAMVFTGMRHFLH